MADVPRANALCPSTAVASAGATKAGPSKSFKLDASTRFEGKEADNAKTRQRMNDFGTEYRLQLYRHGGLARTHTARTDDWQGVGQAQADEAVVVAVVHTVDAADDSSVGVLIIQVRFATAAAVKESKHGRGKPRRLAPSLQLLLRHSQEGDGGNDNNPQTLR